MISFGSKESALRSLGAPHSSPGMEQGSAQARNPSITPLRSFGLLWLFTTCSGCWEIWGGLGASCEDSLELWNAPGYLLDYGVSIVIAGGDGGGD